jgi:anti-anti-sigma factor
MQDFQLLLHEPSAGVLEFKLSGEVDLATVTPLREATRTAAASGEYQWLVFDLLRVTFMDSTGLHVLAEAQHTMSRQGGGTKVVCDAPNLRKVFELTGLDRLLSICSDRSEALVVAA